MHNLPRRLTPYDRMRRVEAGVLALLLAEDWPWRPSELACRLGVPADLITAAAGTLRADGLLVSHGKGVRASWAAVRGNELANSLNSNKCRAQMHEQRAAILVP